MAAAAAEEVEEEEKEAKNPSDGGLSGGLGIRSIYFWCYYFDG